MQSLIRASLVLVVTVIVVACLVDTAPKEAATRTTMWVVKRRILLYARQNNQLPVDLAVIPVLPAYDDSISDAWGRPLHYQINENNTVVTLKSYGQDGLQGGSGQNADIVLSFATHRPDGGWSDQLVNWLEEPKPVSQDQP